MVRLRGCVTAVLLLAAGALARGEDPGGPAPAQALLSDLLARRASKDAEGLRALLPRLVATHNALKEPALRKQLLDAAVGLLAARELAPIHAAVFDALVALDDAPAVFKALRPRIPRDHERVVREHDLLLLDALGRIRLDAVRDRLLALARKVRAEGLRRAAYAALGHYRGTPQEAGTVALMLAALPGLSGSDAESSVDALVRLTGCRVRSPFAWLRAEPANLDGLRALEGNSAAPTPWTWVRFEAQRSIAPEVRASVHAALRWLVAHQSPDGLWQAAGFDRWCDGESRPPASGRGRGFEGYDVGVTGLAVTALLAAGYDGTGVGSHDDAVRKGLAALVRAQNEEGHIGARVRSPYAHGEMRLIGPGRGGRDFEIVEGVPAKDRETWIYSHATAALAIVEGFALSGDPLWKDPAQRALDFLAVCRNPYYAWSYGIKPGRNDTSVTSWMMQPLLVAQAVNRAFVARGHAAPLRIEGEAAEGCLNWLEKVTDSESGRAGYYSSHVTGPARLIDELDRFPGEKSEAMTAAAVFLRCHLGRIRARAS